MLQNRSPRGGRVCVQHASPGPAPRAPARISEPATGRCRPGLRRGRNASQPAEVNTAEGPLSVLEKDLSYLQATTGVDLLTPLADARDVHSQVVALLNPLYGQHLEDAVEQHIARLQQELESAHRQVHASEGRLSSTLEELTTLEQMASSFQRRTEGQASAPLAPPSTSGTAPGPSPVPMASQARAMAQGPACQLPPASVQGRGAVEGIPRNRLLHANLEIPPQLREFWYPAEFGARLSADKPVPVELFGEEWVLFRDEAGAAACVRDACAHRACPLSLGKVAGGRIQCPYHGWEYDGGGACTAMPSTRLQSGIAVPALPVMERDGFVWVWPGRDAPAATLPAAARPPDGFTVHAELTMDVPVDHGLLLENLLDLAHAPFTHTSTFAKGWPVPDVVRFNAQRLLGGHWEPYPIDMSFEPPCMVLSTIGLAQPGRIERGARAAACANHLHQLHVCMPAGRGRTRLLYRMSLDFLSWSRYVPGIQHFWAHIARQVMGEDLVLVVGQQERLAGGADVWANPVSYDKLGVRYRRWRNSVASGDAAQRAAAERELQPLSAGELLAPEGPL